MTNILLAFIVGLLGVNLFVKHAVSVDGSIEKESIPVLIGLVVMIGAVAFGIASLLQ